MCGATLEAGIRLLQICIGHNAQQLVGGVVALFHPGHNVAPAGNFPLVDVRHVTECFEFAPDPKRPLAITARIADENIRHVHAPRDGPALSAGG